VATGPVARVSVDQPNDQGLDSALEGAARFNTAERFLELLVEEQLHGGGAGHPGLHGDLLIGLDVDLDPLGGATQFVKHPLELGLEHMAGATGW
jgi:hypothetical protein